MNGKWSLDVLYKGFDDPKFKADIQKLISINEMINGLEANLTGNSKEKILTILDGFEKQNEVSSDLFNYCSLLTTVNTSDGKAASYIGYLYQLLNITKKAKTRLTKIIAETENLQEVINSDEKLKQYEFLLTNMKESHKYDLNEDVELAISMYDISGGDAWTNLQSTLTSKLKVELDGKYLPLSAARNLAYCDDSAIRKAGYLAELKSYPLIEDAIAYSLNSIKMQSLSECRLRGYDSILDKTLKQSHMKKETLDALLAAIEEYLPKFQSYLKAKAKYLGHENGLPWYDIFAPIGKDEKSYSLEEAEQYLVNLFEKFNPELAKIAKRAFEEAWIDFYPSEGKVGGAFCAELSNQKQFRILTNYDGTHSDLVTLAHELGHGYHSFMVQSHLPLNKNYSLPLAETASTFNENVVLNAAINSSDNDNEKLALLEGAISGVNQIIVDIYSRFLFEKEVCERRSNEFLHPETLCQIMLNAQKKAYGDGLDPDYMHPYMWVCKGHYYSTIDAFYNFPYAFGGLFARGLYELYKKQPDGFLTKFNKLLEMTAVASCEDSAKVCGIDLTDINFWRSSLEAVSKDIDLFIELTSK